ncbi:MAG: TRAP transporter large permease subunit [Rhodospirillaceae bacterium]
MSWWWMLIGGFALVTVLFLTGLPVFICFMVIISIAVLALFGPAAFGMYANSFYDTTTLLSLTTIPMFILMGEILFRSGSIGVLLAANDRLIGRIRGRQYVLTMTLSTMMGALSGSGIAVCAMLGRSVMPVMLERGYDRQLSAGTILAGAMLAPIIPPSVLAIIVGSLADVSIAALLIAGVLPGLILAAAYTAYTLVRVRLDPALAPQEDHVDVPWREKLAAIGQLLPFGFVIFSVLGLIMLGIATPSESAATGVFAAIATAWYYGRLSWRMLFEAVGESAKLTAVILIIMASAILFGQALAYTGATQALGEVTAALGLNRWVMFFIMMLVPFILCMFIDQIGLMLILIPIYNPLINALGFDPIWFYLQFLLNITLGGMTPPFGYLLFTLGGAVPTMPLIEIFRASWAYVWVTLLCMTLFTFFPQIVTTLPRLL